MKMLVLVLLLLTLAVPVHAQEPSPPVHPNIEAVRAQLQQTREQAARLVVMPAAPTDTETKAALAEIRLSLARLEVQLREHEDRPIWLVKVFENRYVHLLLVAAASAITQWQVSK